MTETIPRGKRIMVVVGHYPSPYKPYYDTQLADLVNSGYAVDIVAARPLDATGHEKAKTAGLLERTRYYPTAVREAGVAAIRDALLHPFRALRLIRATNGAPLRRKTGDLLRMVSFPRARPDLILVHGLGVSIMFPWLRNWFGDIPLAMYYHGGEVPSVGAHEAARAAAAFRQFNVVFTNTNFARDQAIARGCPSNLLRVLPVGFDLNEYRPPAPRRYRHDGVLRVMSSGRLSEEKGLVDTLDALKLIVDSGRTGIRLSIAGDGYMRKDLEQRVEALSLTGYVEFMGALPNSQVSEKLGQADVLVLSSFAKGTWTETQACAVQEALLMKALVVTTRTGGVPESIPDVMRRFSVAERDIHGLAAALTSIYDMPLTDLEPLAAAGREFAAAHYDIRLLNQKLLAEIWALSQRS